MIKRSALLTTGLVAAAGCSQTGYGTVLPDAGYAAPDDSSSADARAGDDAGGGGEAQAPTYVDAGAADAGDGAAGAVDAGDAACAPYPTTTATCYGGVSVTAPGAYGITLLQGHESQSNPNTCAVYATPPECRCAATYTCACLYASATPPSCPDGSTGIGCFESPSGTGNVVLLECEQ